MRSTSTSAAESLRSALVRQFGASAQGAIDRQLEQTLRGRKKLQRQDLDAIEQGVLAAVRQGRGCRSTGSLPDAERAPTASSHRPATSSAAALGAALAPISPPRSGFGMMAQTMPSGFGTSPGGKPKAKPRDHFDLMAEFTDAKHREEDAEKLRKKQAQNAQYRADLDKQVLERTQQREREKAEALAERQKWNEEILTKESEYRAAEDAERQKKALKRKEVRGWDLEAQRAAERRKLRHQLAVRNEGERLECALEHDRRHFETQKQLKRDKQAVERQRIDEQAGLSRTRIEQERQDRLKADKRFMADSVKMHEARDANHSAVYQERQKIVDHITGTLGARNAQERARQEREFDERIDREFEESNRRKLDQYWQEIADRQRTLQNMAATNATLHLEVSGRAGAQKEEGKRQQEIWQRQAQESHAKEQGKAAQKKKTRLDVAKHSIEVSSMRATVHPANAGVTPKMLHREVQLNSHAFKRMADEGFRPGESHAMAMTATLKQAPDFGASMSMSTIRLP